MLRPPVWIFCLFALAVSGLAHAVTIRVEVTPPEETPADARLYIAGSAEALGPWDPGHYEMQRNDDGTYSAEVDLPDGEVVAYKITRGDWATVEKGEFGEEIQDRVLTAEQGLVVQITIPHWADTGPTPAPPPVAAPEPIRSSRTGDIREHPGVGSAFLELPRDVLVYLPPGYDEHPDQRYPVLYMHDGQNLFDNATSFLGVEWGVDEAATRLIEAGQLPPIIIVAISNTYHRLSEYAPEDGGEAYGRFVVEELKPFIDATYRTQPGLEYTAVAGSSLGGLISLDLTYRYPEVFSRCAALSPALWWNELAVLEPYRTVGEWGMDKRFWVDMGTEEGRMPGADEATQLQYARDFGAILADQGVEHHLEIVEGAAHTEAAWAARIDDVLVFLYSAP